MSEVAACPWGASPLSCRLPEPPALCDLFPRALAGSFRPGQHGLFRAAPTWLVCAGRRHAVRASTLRPLPHACVPPPQTSLSPTFRSFLPPGPRPASPAAHNRPRACLCSSLGDLCCPPEGVTRPRPTPTARVSHPRLLSKAPVCYHTSCTHKPGSSPWSDAAASHSRRRGRRSKCERGGGLGGVPGSSLACSGSARV